MKYTNFQDIPERMKAYYQIDVFLKDLDFVVDRYLKEFNLQLNPDFQRGHVWTEEQQIAYVEFLLTDPDRDKSTMVVFNCPGWMGKNWKKDMVCVDGLQRITACLRFFRNEIPAYGTYYKDYSGHTSAKLQFVVGAFHKRSDVLKWYLEINAKGTPHTDEELKRVSAMLSEEISKEN